MLSDFGVTGAASLSISCVTFNTNQDYFSATLSSLVSACSFAKAQGSLADANLYLIDNGPDTINTNFLNRMSTQYADKFKSVQMLSGHGNTGYGRANNLAIMNSSSDFHLVLNPDVILAEDNIHVAISYMSANPDVGLLAPDAEGVNGQRQFIAKRTPSFFVLFARAFRSSPQNKWLRNRLHYYEYRDLIPAKNPFDIALASGCYMLLCRETAQKVGGFDSDFFMYFEDFNLSQRIHLTKRVIHHPQVKVIHYGGGAASKGDGHIRLFLSSYFKFILKSYSLKQRLTRA